MGKAKGTVKLKTELEYSIMKNLDHWIQNFIVDANSAQHHFIKKNKKNKKSLNKYFSSHKGSFLDPHSFDV